MNSPSLIVYLISAVIVSLGVYIGFGDTTKAQASVAYGVAVAVAAGLLVYVIGFTVILAVAVGIAIGLIVTILHRVNSLELPARYGPNFPYDGPGGW